VTGRTNWRDVRDARLTDEGARDRYDAARQDLDARLALHSRTLRELRRARELTQAQLAQGLRVSQAQVSRVESQADLYLSTLRSYVEAMGGELELRVVFGDGSWTEVDLADVAPAPEPESDWVGTFEIRIVRPDAKRGWVVVKPGAARASAVAETKAGAVRRAMDIVRRGGGGEVVVQDRQGRRSTRTVRPATAT
jgi:transcriptional regulator with XRE-family HTH domain